MFRSIRIKLTIWYLFIIMLISMIFSLVIYTIITRELERGFRRVEMHFRTGEMGVFLPRQFLQREEINPQLIEDLKLAKKRVALNLLIVNGMILGISSVAGYFLAGKTLKPIEIAMEDQKRFVADASHELRTPLTSLKTSIEVALREKKITIKEAKTILTSSLEDIASLESLTNNLLSLTRYQQINGNIIFQTTDISEVIQNAYKKILPLAKKKNIAIKLKIADQKLVANKQSLEEMIVIFLDNAVKYTPKKGKVFLRLNLDKKELIIEVKDTGIGISQNDIPHIFDRFYRVDQSRSKENVPGFGLGLSLAKKIIEMHKGSMAVASELTKGTTFTIKLPIKHF